MPILNKGLITINVWAAEKYGLLINVSITSNVKLNQDILLCKLAILHLLFVDLLLLI